VYGRPYLLPGPPVPVSRALVLVVDDAEDNRIVFKAGLEHAGYAVLVAPGGREAVALARTQPPDLILMDLRMPGESGADVAVRIHAEAAAQAIPILAVTADLLIPDETLRDAGFCGVLRLPVPLAKFLATVDQCVGEGARPGWIEDPLPYRPGSTG
jgi:CheY-like chemotaxis protein